ncbi:Ig-like domain-containing protein, partial [Eubacterium aggregans]|uniref:Ig-like domain-containing protein n=1 Tax=Eubacterium aggregans TaxID=81409 RepID=UPI003F30B705
MNSVFFNCSSLTTLDLSSFDTNMVTNMMVTNMDQLFQTTNSTPLLVTVGEKGDKIKAYDFVSSHRTPFTGTATIAAEDGKFKESTSDAGKQSTAIQPTCWVEATSLDTVVDTLLSARQGELELNEGKAFGSGVPGEDYPSLTEKLNGSYTATTKKQDMPITKVEIPGTLTAYSNELQDITATITPADATNQKITWHVNNEALASVTARAGGDDNIGTLTPKAQGTVTLTATFVENPALSTICTVTIKLSAGSVRKEIDELPSPITLDDVCKAAIEKAEADYASLEAEQQARVTNYNKLQEARTTYDNLEAIKAVEEKIIALPAPESLNYENKEAVCTANDAYTALTEDQKAQVSKSNTEKLKQAVENIQLMDNLLQRIEVAQTAVKENKGNINTALEKLVAAMIKAGDFALEFQEEIQATLQSAEVITKANHHQEMTIGGQRVDITAEYDGTTVLSSDVRLEVAEGKDATKEAQKAEGAADKTGVLNLSIRLMDIKTGKEIQPEETLKVTTKCDMTGYKTEEILVAHLKEGHYKETLNGSYNKETNSIEFKTN